MAPDRHPGCPGAPPANVRGAFNAHSPGDGGSGLVQPVFRSPARIPAAESSRRGLCAAPPSEKRYTLSHISAVAMPPSSGGGELTLFRVSHASDHAPVWIELAVGNGRRGE